MERFLSFLIFFSNYAKYMKRIIAPTKLPTPVIWGLLIIWPERDLMKIYGMAFLLIPYLKGMKTTEWIVGLDTNNPKPYFEGWFDFLHRMMSIHQGNF